MHCPKEMTKYKAKFNENGLEDYEEELFDSYEEAEEYGYTILSACALGAEILRLSNPGDHPEPDEDEDPAFSVIEVES